MSGSWRSLAAALASSPRVHDRRRRVHGAPRPSPPARSDAARPRADRAHRRRRRRRPRRPPTPPPDRGPHGSPAPTTAPTPASRRPVAHRRGASLPAHADRRRGQRSSTQAEPQRIVSLTPATTEIVFALGVGDRLVGEHGLRRLPAEAVDLPHVATSARSTSRRSSTSAPTSSSPAATASTSRTALAQLRRLGIPVLVALRADVEGVLKDIELVGQAIGRPDEAADARRRHAQIDQVHRRTRRPPAAPADFYEIDATKEIYGPADDSFIAEMIALAGGDADHDGQPDGLQHPAREARRGRSRRSSSSATPPTARRPRGRRAARAGAR